MSVTQIIPDLYQLTIPTPFAVGPVNVYVAVHATVGPTLIDTGPRTDQARTALEEGLAVLGYSPADVQRVIVTHAHTDHYGLAGDIARVSGARVYSHPHSRPMLEDYAAEREKLGAFYYNLLIETGVPEAVRATVVQILRGFRQFATAISPVHALDEGDELELAAERWQVLFMPGHAGGLICLYQPQKRLFLSNDHLLRDISSNPFFEPPPPGQSRRRRSLVDYIASLQRTAAMDVAVAWPGHGAPIRDHRALIEERLAFHQRRADRIVAALQDGPRTVYALSRLVFPELNTMDRFLALSEVLAHVEWLEDAGAVTSHLQNGVFLWQNSR